ncbi:uncharacterized protein METZ01_LOCUS83332 [marine metagenome]|uniref:Uncharacterized protein n=1 Tax=marine metagenome TaxID=408172 RepID=A0A381US72_9ZZZZ
MVGLAQTLQIMGTLCLAVWLAWWFDNNDGGPTA